MISNQSLQSKRPSLQKSGAKPENHENVPQSGAHGVKTFYNKAVYQSWNDVTEYNR